MSRSFARTRKNRAPRPPARSMVRFCVLACALAWPGCGKPADAPPGAASADKGGETKHGLTAAEAAEPLLVIGETTVTVGDFADQLADKSPYLRARYASPERRRELLDDLVKFELLAREAARRGLDKTDEVQRTKQQLMVQQMMKVEFEDKVKLSDITDADIQAYYASHPDEYNKPAQVRTSEIVLKDEARARRALKQVLDKPGDDALFRELAKSGDDAALADRAGDRQFFSRPSDRRDDDPEVPDAVATTAFALDKIGDVSPGLVKTAQGFHVVKLTGKRKELARTLEQARRPIQHRLWRERREAAIDAFVKSLRSEANVQENWAMLDQVELRAPEDDAAKGSPPNAASEHSPRAAAGRDAGKARAERAAKRGSP